jgi:dynein heavy chain
VTFTYVLPSDDCLHRAEKSRVVDRINESVVSAMTEDVFQYAVRGFFDVDKLTFSLLLALTVEMKAGKVTQEEFTTFIKGTK